jgi:SAM-dependent methyltransferase
MSHDTGMSSHADYDNFAWLYNQEWTYFPEHIFPLYKHLAGDCLPEGGQVLDLCCGTGQLARVLTENGYKVTGLDISAGQLRCARKNAPKAHFIRADARSFTLKQKFNAVFCTFDALNHFMTIEDLVKVFKSVSACLADGGIFVFDMITKKEFEKNMDGHRDITEKPGYLYTLRVEYYPEKRLGEFHCTLFRQYGKSWRRSDTVIQETYYTPAQVRSALKKAGITKSFTCAADPQNGIYPPDKNTRRIFYFARKC